MRKFSIFLFLSLLLLQSCQPAVKAASFPLTASHIKAATETVSSQILEKDSETQLYHAIREWGKQISLLDICTGDIGNDGAADAAIIVEYPCTGEFGSYRKRTIFVILDTMINGELVWDSCWIFSICTHLPCHILDMLPGICYS